MAASRLSYYGRSLPNDALPEGERGCALTSATAGRARILPPKFPQIVVFWRKWLLPSGQRMGMVSRVVILAARFAQEFPEVLQDHLQLSHRSSSPTYSFEPSVTSLHPKPLVLASCCSPIADG